MSIEWFRDLVVIIGGLCLTVAVIIIVILAFRLYSRLKPLLDSMNNTARVVGKIASTVETELAGPLTQLVSFVQGVKQAIGMVNHFFKREEEA
jgi:hypothetical protein